MGELESALPPGPTDLIRELTEQIEAFDAGEPGGPAGDGAE
jgi:hypothetical protein